MILELNNIRLYFLNFELLKTEDVVIYKYRDK